MDVEPISHLLGRGCPEEIVAELALAPAQHGTDA